MLGDAPEKSKNPLKKAIRRRNAKTVQFAAPTYVEASDYDYSSDDDEQGMSEPHAAAAQHVEPERGQPVEVEERNAPEEANVHATRRYSSESVTKGDGSSKTSMDSKRSSAEDPQLSPKLVDRSGTIFAPSGVTIGLLIQGYRGCATQVPKRYSSQCRLVPQRRVNRDPENLTHSWHTP